MALKKTETFKGIDVIDAITTVELITILQDKTSMEVVTQVRALKGFPPFRGESYVCPFDSGKGDPFQQAYAHLKTLIEFEGATDC